MRAADHRSPPLPGLYVSAAAVPLPAPIKHARYFIVSIPVVEYLVSDDPESAAFNILFD